MSYYNSETSYVTLATQVDNNTITMLPINGLSINLSVGLYSIEFSPLYNVNAITTGTGWNFQGGTAVLGNYSFTSILPNTTTSNFFNNYSSRNQNYSTTATSRTIENRGLIKAEFNVTTAGTLIPFFRSELAGAMVSVLPGSYIKITKIN